MGLLLVLPLGASAGAAINVDVFAIQFCLHKYFPFCLDRVENARFSYSSALQSSCQRNFQRMTFDEKQYRPMLLNTEFAQ